MDTLVRLVRVGDDFSLSGRRLLCNTFRDELGKHLLVKTTAAIDPTVEMGGGERWELAADPRHVEILASQTGLCKESKAVSAPGVRTTDEKDGKELGAEDRACYRSWTMRASYLRCELQFAV